MSTSEFPAGESALAELIRSHDWAATPLGPIEAWPQSLRTNLQVMLDSPVAIVTLWGERGTMIYNDAYAEFAGQRHPALLGSEVRSGWDEVSDFNDNILNVVLAGGTLSYTDHPLVLDRFGKLETVYFNLDYSPLRDEAGKPVGVMAVVVEFTEAYRARIALEESARRLAFLDALGRAVSVCSDADAILAITTRMTAEHLGVSSCAYADMDADEDGFTIRGDWHAPGSPPLLGHFRLADFGKLAVKELGAGRPLVIDDNLVQLLPHEAKAFQDLGVTATVCMPLVKEGRLTALMAIHDKAPHAWSDYERTIIREVTERSWAHIERVRAVEQLAEREAELRRAQAAGGVGVFSVDVTTNVIACTPEFCRIFGVEPCETVTTDEIDRLLFEEDKARIASAKDRLAGKGPLDVEYRIHRADTGEERIIARKAEFERDAEGKPLRMVGVVQDTTERHRVQSALEKSEAGFSALAQSMPNQVWTARADGLLDWCNAQAYAYSGNEPGSLDGANWTRIVHPDDAPAAAERWAAAVANGDVYQTEFRLRSAQGEWRWFIARAMPIRDSRGRITSWVGTNTDIHEQKLAEAESSRDRDRLWTLSRDILLVSDFEGRITAINPSAQQLLGWREDEMVGRLVTDFVHEDDLASTAAETAKIAEGEATLAFENRYREKDGGYRLLAWTAVPDQDRIHGVGRDITEQRATEEALRQSQKMEAVGQLTGGIAHDFNNLLQGITGSLDIMESRIAQGRMADIDRWLTGAKTSANRASALTHRLLAFSRRQPLDPRPVRANPLIGSIEDMLRRTLGEMIELELVLGGGLWLTRCDPNQLESAIINLAINARDAMPDGGKLTIETCNAHLDSIYAARERDVRPGQYVCICVSDTGTGMTKDVIARAFEPFFTTKPMGQGTGLGLSMIYGFTRQSEGYARIYSEVGHGTTIKLYLPRYRGEAPAEEHAPGLAEAPGSHEGEIVLVVEDEPVVRGLIVEVLGELGYRALEAADGPKGLEILQSKQRIDLLVTDIGLPGLNGRQVADAARLVRPELKVLFMTGYAENAALASGFLEPGMSMITKPFAMEQLANRVRAIIEEG